VLLALNILRPKFGMDFVSATYATCPVYLAFILSPPSHLLYTSYATPSKADW